MRKLLDLIFNGCKPISFTERRIMVKQRWARYGYQYKARTHRTGALPLQDKINSLMVQKFETVS